MDSAKTRRTTVAADHDAGPIRLRGQVWVAEDNVVHRLVIEACLIRLGWQVSLAHDGQQALEAMETIDARASTDRPDLIRVDLPMPVPDGDGASETIRQWAVDKQRPRLPIMALTADAFATGKPRCLAVVQRARPGCSPFCTCTISIGRTLYFG